MNQQMDKSDKIMRVKLNIMSIFRFVSNNSE